ncbi:MAG: glycosyltransferase family 2 protein [Solirubrobacterales bacterium]
MSPATEVRDAAPSAPTTAELDVSVVMPCLNEASSIAEAVREARATIDANGYRGEVVVVDNGSTDGSGELAREAGARVVSEPERGYGNAYRAGLAAARGRYILMLDADGTYPVADLPRFIGALEEGADMVMGDRFEQIQRGVMPWLHRYVGNPLLTGILNIFFRTGVKDAHCGMRALRREVLPDLDLRTSGMEFASEMVIRAGKLGLDIREFPISYHPREGESKLSTWSDGWRHLRFLLVHSPTHLFVIPGAVIAALSVLVIVTSLAQIQVLGREWDIHAMIAGSLGLIVGAQVVGLGLCAHTYGTYFMGERDDWFDRARGRIRLNQALIAGALVIGGGLVLAAVVVGIWIDRGFGQLSEERLAVLAATLIVVGIQAIFTAFLISILGLRKPDE